MPAISRGLSEATPPEGKINRADPGGVAAAVALVNTADAGSATTPPESMESPFGNRWRCCAKPPA